MSQGQERAITQRKIQQLALRIYRTTRFDTETIRELKEDRTATGQAVAVLLLVGLSYGLGFSIFSGLEQGTLSLDYLISNTLANMIITDFAAFIWSATVFLVGTKLFQGKTGYWQLARPLFFYSPRHPLHPYRNTNLTCHSNNGCLCRGMDPLGRIRRLEECDGLQHATNALDIGCGPPNPGFHSDDDLAPWAFRI